MDVVMVDVIAKARDLRSVDGENAEYDRALVDLSMSVLGLDPDEDRNTIEKLIRGGVG